MTLVKFKVHNLSFKYVAVADVIIDFSYRSVLLLLWSADDLELLHCCCRRHCLFLN